MTSVYGYDNLYSDSVNDIALMNYNKGIAQRLRMQQDVCDQRLPFKEPKMLSGGVRASNTILAGTSAEGPSTLAVGGRAYRRFTGNETAMQGGNKFTDFAKKTGNISKKILKVGVPVLSGAIGTVEGGPAMGLSTAKASSALTDYLLGSGKKPRGRKPKEGGKVSMKDIIHYGKVGVDTASDMYDLYGKVKSKLGGGPIMDKVSNVINKVKSREGMVYSQDLKDALSKSVKGLKKPLNIIEGGSCCGGARKARFAKGSPEAKAFMASIRAKKSKK